MLRYRICKIVHIKKCIPIALSLRVLYGHLQKNPDSTFERSNKVRHGEMSWKVTTQANLIFQDMEWNHKAVSINNKKGTHTDTHILWINFTAPLPHSSKPRQTCNRTENPQRAANKVQGTKTRQSASSKRIWAALPRRRFFNSSLLDADVIHQRWQMWHDSSAREAAVTKDRTLYSTVCDKGRFVKTKPHMPIYGSIGCSLCSADRYRRGLGWCSEIYLGKKPHIPKKGYFNLWKVLNEFRHLITHIFIITQWTNSFPHKALRTLETVVFFRNTKPFCPHISPFFLQRCACCRVRL